MQYELLTINENMQDYKTKLLHPYLISNFYENLKNAENFQNFISKNQNSTWFIFSDYCLDDNNKPKNVVTFTILALKNRQDFTFIQRALDLLQPKDLKKSKAINPSFLNFISLLPIFNVSYILPDNRNITKAFKFEELSFLKMRYHSLENYYKRLQAFPVKDNDFTGIIKDFKLIQTKFEAKSISLKIYRDIEIINCAVSSISILISSQFREPQKIFWVSDRDNILTFEKAKLSLPLIFSMIHASFKSFIKTESSLAFFNHENTGKPELDSMNRIPDIVSGTLAEMTDTTVGKDKYVLILRNYLTNQSVNHIAKLHLNEEQYGLNTILLKKS